MDDVIIGSDLYHKSNPEELQNFKKFVERTKPYDIVIDSLNVMHKHKDSPKMVTFFFFKLYIYIYIYTHKYNIIYFLIIYYIIYCNIIYCYMV